MPSEQSVAQSAITDEKSGTSSPKALVVVDHVPPSERESAILERLSEHLGYELSLLEGKSLTAQDLTSLDLVVVCSNADIPVVREAAVPVLVCRSDALYGLGMTLAQPNVDFGNSNYERIHLEETAVEHSLAAGLAGKQHVALTAGSRGWGKPGVAAHIVATINGNREQATIFAYSHGKQMPTIKAPHRRIAFLITGDQISSATGRNWDLFDAAVAWAKNGEKEIANAQLTDDGHWLAKPDAPSRLLSADEFREWRDDRVAKRVFIKLGTIFSALGVGGLIAGSAYLNSVISNTQEDLKKELTTQIEDDLVAYLDQDIPEKIAVSIVAVGKLDEILANKTSSIATEVAEEFVNVEAEKAVKEKLATGGLDHLVYTKLHDSISDTELSPVQRIQALRLLVSFSSDPAELRSDLQDVIGREQDIEVLKVALESFLPAKITDDLDATEKQEFEQDNLDALGVILRRLYGSDLRPIHPSFSLALSNFPAPLLIKSIKGDVRHQACPVVIDALCSMEGDEPIRGLAALAFSGNESENVQYLGWRGLSGLKVNPELKTSEARQDALRQLLDRLFNGSLPNQNRDQADLKPHLNQLIKAMKNFDNAAIRNLERDARDFQDPQLDEIYHSINEGQLHVFREKFTNAGDILAFLEQTGRNIPRMKALLNLLHPDDWEIVSSRIVEPDNPPDGWREAADILLYNWVAKLESAGSSEGEYEHTADLLDKSLALHKALSFPGSIAAIDFAIRKGGSAEAAVFLKELPLKYEKGIEFRSQNALATAIKNDADAFRGTKQMLLQINSARHKDWGLYETVCENLKPALNDETVREFLFTVVNEKDPASSKAGLYAVETLGHRSGGLSETALVNAADGMLAQLGGLTINSPVPETFTSSEPEATGDRKIQLISALIKKLDRFCEFAEEDERIVLGRIRDGLPSEKDEEMAYVRNQLVSLAKTRHVARAASNKKDLKKAIEDSTFAIELDHQMAGAYLARGSAYFKLRNYDAAIEDYRTLISLEPNEPSHHNELGKALRRKGEETCEEAVEEFKKAIDLRGDNLADKWEMALAYIVLGNEDLAVEYTHEVRDQRVEEERAGVQENLGILYLRRGEFQKAFENTEKVLEMAGGQEMAWNWLVRAIALKQMDENSGDEENKKKEDVAFKKWVEFGKKKWLHDLKELIPAELFDPYEQRTMAADPEKYK